MTFRKKILQGLHLQGLATMIGTYIGSSPAETAPRAPVEIRSGPDPTPTAPTLDYALEKAAMDSGKKMRELHLGEQPGPIFKSLPPEWKPNYRV